MHIKTRNWRARARSALFDLKLFQSFMRNWRARARSALFDLKLFQSFMRN
jgi:hypothetical protein